MNGSFRSYTYNITALLGRASFPNDSAKPVNVPPFQRGYSWENIHVATLWEDIISFHEQMQQRNSQENYFFGPIVIRSDTNSVHLLDGQQRLATITIFLGVIRDIARTKGQNGSDLARDIHRDLIMVNDDSGTHALNLGELDDPFFKNYIQRDPPDLSITARLRSHRLIQQARKFLDVKVQSYIDGMDLSNQLRRLKDIQRTIAANIKLVAIEVKSEEEAFLIFETLNDRGLRLAVPDLVLNHLMRVAENSNERDRIRQHWNQVVENIKQRKVSTFVRHMWVSRYGDVKAQGLYREIRDNLQTQQITSVQFAELCDKESENYIAITSLNKSKLPDESLQFIEALMIHLSVDRTLPLLLSALVCLERADFVKLAHYAVTVVVRHSVLANLNPTDLETALYKAARNLRKKRESGSTSSEALIEAKNVLMEINPTRDQITSGIVEAHLTQKQANYIVYAIAERLQSDTGAKVDLSNNSIEHIFPTNASESQWPQKEEMEPFIWHIGNLTVLETGLNREADNKDYATKKVVYSRSELKINKSLPDNYSDWNTNSIIDRAKALLPTIRDIWKERI